MLQKKIRLPYPVSCLKSLAFGILVLFSSLISAQENIQKAETKSGQLIFDLSLNNYIFKDDYIFNPILTVDKGNMHLETRYNYEALKTLSVFGGYNIEVGNELYFKFTPMFGIAFGETNGIIPALEFTITYGSLEWYSESEHMIITDEGGDNFFYAWSEFNFYPEDWLSLGVIGTRTRLYEMDSDVLGGVSIGYYHKNFDLMASLLNFDIDDPIFYLSATFHFQ